MMSLCDPMSDDAPGGGVRRASPPGSDVSRGTCVATARGLHKRYGKEEVLKGIDFSLAPGRIVGLIGPNGAGKTTILKSMLGLTGFDGEMEVLGFDPRRQRAELMREVSFVADVAVLPRWLKVADALDFMSGVHPRFSRDKAEHFLAKTKIRGASKVGQLSKGMIAQLHLALVMAIDARLLVLDEPTLGLDILFRKTFYSNLLNEYFGEQRSILITTHQVEEIEHILTDLLFIDNGRIVLDASMEQANERFVELRVRPDATDRAQALNPLNQWTMLGRKVMVFDGVERERLAELGDVGTPSLADLFVAHMPGELE